MNERAGQPAVVVDKVTKRYRDVTALDGVSFTVAAGSTMALLGGNGAGKTTTISILLGLLLPTAGAVRVLGHDMLRERHRVLGRMNFSSPYVDLPRRLSVAENLTVYAHLYGLADPVGRIRSLAAALDLADFLDRPTGDLSSGQRTRVALAKAMLNAPRLLLLDEPTASLDPDTADWVRGYLQAYQRESGATIVLASHNMSEVERMCDDVVVMRAGVIVDRGAPAALIAKYGRQTMEEVFLDIARDRRAPSLDTRLLASR
ncbi:MAG: ABC transporter ATP-binding protein [Rhodospirillales bacterium]|nr:ABC transporter ATP-binding protein [Rhodospirillales bacterium]